MSIYCYHITCVIVNPVVLDERLDFREFICLVAQSDETHLEVCLSVWSLCLYGISVLYLFRVFWFFMWKYNIISRTNPCVISVL